MISAKELRQKTKDRREAHIRQAEILLGYAEEEMIEIAQKGGNEYELILRSCHQDDPVVIELCRILKSNAYWYAVGVSSIRIRW